MPQITAVDAFKAQNKIANYNAVKITVNDAKANINNINSLDGDATYNGVSIEVNRPSMEVAKNEPVLYSYPQAQEVVTYDFIDLPTMDVPQLPVYTAYEITGIVADVDNDGEDVDLNSVPEPNITSTQEEKLAIEDIAFKSLNFKGSSSISFEEPMLMEASVSKEELLANLLNEDFDVQAIQMDEIVKTAMLSPENAKGYISNEIFSTLIDIVNKDTSSLTPPTEKQTKLRKQIIINEIIKKQAEDNNEDLDKIELPFVLSEKEIQEAITLAPMEQAERNKEYALYTIALLAKVYADDVEKVSGNVVPLTELPGSDVFVDTMLDSNNASLKIAAMDALKYIYRPEYKNEIKSLITMATTDKNPYVAKNAEIILETLK